MVMTKQLLFIVINIYFLLLNYYYYLFIMVTSSMVPCLLILVKHADVFLEFLNDVACLLHALLDALRSIREQATLLRLHIIRTHLHF